MDETLILNETFESKDPREKRRIQIISREGETRTGRPKYQYVTLAHQDKHLIGRKGFISDRILMSRWKKVTVDP